MTNEQRVRIIVYSGAGPVERDLGPLGRFDQVVIGRGADVGVFISDPSIGRAHCKIFRDGEVLYVKHLDGKGGSFVDDLPVTQPVRLRHNQQLRLGNVRVDVVWGDAAAREATERSDASEPPSLENARGDRDQNATDPASADRAREPPASVPAARGRETRSASRREHGAANVAGGNPNNFWAAHRERSARQRRVTIVRPRDSKPLPPASEAFEIVLEGTEIQIGRDAKCDLPFSKELLISGRHAKLKRIAGNWVIQDLASSNGTFLNGERVQRPATLDPGDLVSIGPYQLTYTGDSLTTQPHSGASSIEVRGVAVPGRGKDLVLRDVSFAIEAGELVGLLGISGSGKTRLMHSMCGRAPIVAGDIRYDGRDFASNQDALRSKIGYVPSWLTLHDSLNVADGLRYASRLRLADDASLSEIEANIDRVLGQLRIAELKSAAMKTLSDGQKRRVGLAVELLGSPPVMLLDEVTTALDLPTHCQFMKLFRDLADSGKSLLLISHHLEDMEICDKWLYLIGGRVAFFGTPKQFCGYFGVSTLREQLEVQADGNEGGEEWARRFTNAYGPPIFAPNENTPSGHAHSMSRPGRRWRNIARQSKLLTARYVSLLKADRRNLAIMLSLAPVIAGIMLLLHVSLQSSVDDARNPFDAGVVATTELMRPLLGKWMEAELAQSRLLVFMVVMSTIIVGTFMSVREIVKENDIVRHERFAGKDYIAYLASKIGPLSLLAVASSIGIALLLRLFAGSDAIDADIGPLLALVGITALSSVLLGLMISAVVDSSEKAFLILAPVLIVQLTLSGAMVPLPNSLRTAAKFTVLGYWPNAGIASLVPDFHAGIGHIDEDLAKNAKPEELALQNTVPWARASIFTLLHGIAYMLVTYLLLLRRDGYPMGVAMRREATALGLLPTGRGSAS